MPFCIVPPESLTRPFCVCVVPPKSRTPPDTVSDPLVAPSVPAPVIFNAPAVTNVLPV